MAQSSSGTFAFQPSIAEFVRLAFARIGVFAPALTIQHLADARMVANLILTEWGANRGLNLPQIDQLQIPLQPGVASYVLPRNTVDLVDVYLRTMSPSTTSQNLGAVITVLGPLGNPLVGTPFGDPLLVNPGSGALSCVVGSQTITLKWPAHQLSAGNPIFWGCPVSIGGLMLTGFSVVDSVIDANTVTFVAPIPALETQVNQGGTRLFSTNTGSGTVACIMPSHGLAPGGDVTLAIPLTIGGLTLTGPYTVASVINDYEFTFAPGGVASSTDSLFENGGQKGSQRKNN